MNVYQMFDHLNALFDKVYCLAPDNSIYKSVEDVPTHLGEMDESTVLFFQTEKEIYN